MKRLRYSIGNVDLFLKKKLLLKRNLFLAEHEKSLCKVLLGLKKATTKEGERDIWKAR